MKVGVGGRPSIVWVATIKLSVAVVVTSVVWVVGLVWVFRSVCKAVAVTVTMVMGVAAVLVDRLTSRQEQALEYLNTKGARVGIRRNAGRGLRNLSSCNRHLPCPQVGMVMLPQWKRHR
jgi:hypothetical protein